MGTNLLCRSVQLSWWWLPKARIPNWAVSLFGSRLIIDICHLATCNYKKKRLRNRDIYPESRCRKTPLAAHFSNPKTATSDCSSQIIGNNYENRAQSVRQWKYQRFEIKRCCWLSERDRDWRRTTFTAHTNKSHDVNLIPTKRDLNCISAAALARLK